MRRRKPSRLAAVLLLASLLALAGAPVATATPVLDAPDAAELAQSLAEATADQDVCYGWEIVVQDYSGGSSGPDTGSNFGPDVPLDEARRAECPRWAVLTGTIVYTSELSESEDDAAAEVVSNLNPAPTLDDLRELGVQGSLTADDNDVVLTNMVEGLPLAVAATGQAPYVQFETSDNPAAVAGEPTGTPGSDVLRQSWPLILICGLAVLGGVIMLLGVLVSRLTRRVSPSQPSHPLTPTDFKGP